MKDVRRAYEWLFFFYFPPHLGILFLFSLISKLLDDGTFVIWDTLEPDDAEIIAAARKSKDVMTIAWLVTWSLSFQIVFQIVSKKLF